MELALAIVGILALGLVFGFQHAFDADHLAAVSVLAAKSGENAAIKKGVMWGLGHTAALLALGGLILFFGISLTPEWNKFFEKLTGVMLLGFGAWAMRDFFASRRKYGNFFAHSHPPAGFHVHRHPSFWVGALHGLGGSAALFALYISTAESALLGLIFILTFGLGSILGMGFFGFLIGKAAERFKKYTGFAAGVFSLCTGLVLLFPELL